MYGDDFDPFAVVVGDNKEGRVPFCAMPDEEDAPELHAAHAKGIKLYILDPRNYAAAGRRNKWTSQITRLMMPPILRLLMLTIGYETRIDLQDGRPPVLVGQTIPKCDFYTIQVQMNPREKREHDQRTLHLLSKIGNSKPADKTKGKRPATTTAEREGLVENTSEEGNINAGVYRALKIGTFDPRLLKIVELVNSEMTKAEKKAMAKTRVNSWTGKDPDHGASYTYIQTRAGPEYGVPTDRLSLAKYMTGMAAKIRVAFGILAENLEKGLKTILVFEFPLPLW